MFGTSPNSSLVLLPLADFNLCLFSVISYNHEYNSSQEFCESFWRIIKTQGGVGNSLNLQLCQKWALVWMALPLTSLLTVPTEWAPPRRLSWLLQALPHRFHIFSYHVITLNALNQDSCLIHAWSMPDPMATVTNYHKFSYPKKHIYYLIVLEVRIPT